MTIWIRSQDKKRLVNCNAFIATENSRLEYILEGYEINGDCSILGKYSTRKKAIKVLDIIQEHIAKHSNNVFEMPQYNEVEV